MAREEARRQAGDAEVPPGRAGSLAGAPREETWLGHFPVWFTFHVTLKK